MRSKGEHTSHTPLLRAGQTTAISLIMVKLARAERDSVRVIVTPRSTGDGHDRVDESLTTRLERTHFKSVFMEPVVASNKTSGPATTGARCGGLSLRAPAYTLLISILAPRRFTFE